MIHSEVVYHIEIMNRIKNKAGGRPPKIDPVTHRITVNFNNREQADFLAMYENSGEKSKASFIKARVFNKEFRVAKVDRTALDFCQQLSSLHNQFRAVGRNYNQVVVALKRSYTDLEVRNKLSILEALTMNLYNIGTQITTLTDKFKYQYGRKN